MKRVWRCRGEGLARGVVMRNGSVYGDFKGPIWLCRPGSGGGQGKLV